MDSSDDVRAGDPAKPDRSESQARNTDQSVVSPARPRGSASFAGGAPPTSSPPQPPPTAAEPAANPEPAPAFQVTVVEHRGASRPAGPPPPARTEPVPLPEPVGDLLTAVPEDDEDEAAAAAPQPAPSDPDPTQPATAVLPAVEVPTDQFPAARPRARGGQRPAAGEDATGQGRAPHRPSSSRKGTSDTEVEPFAGTAGGSAAVGSFAESAGGSAAGGRTEGRTDPPGGPTEPPTVPAADAGQPPAVSPDAPTQLIDLSAQPPAATPPEPPTEVLPAAPAQPPAEPDAGAEPPAEQPAETPGRRGRRRRGRRRGTPTTALPTDEAAGQPSGPSPATQADGTPAEAATAARSQPAAEGAPAATVEAGEDEEDADPSAGSSRTRARRRRRAAARARHRADTDDEAADTTEEDRQVSPPDRRPAEAAGSGVGAVAESALAAEAAAKAPATDRPAEPSGRGRRRGGNRDNQRNATETKERKPDNGQGRSTRLTSRGPGRGDRGRRRRTGLSEEQKRLLREQGTEKRMLVSEHEDRTQIAVAEDRTLVEHYVTTKAGRSQVGNIYLGRVQNVLPGMEAAFVDVGKGRNAVLYAGEVTYNEEDLDGEAPRIERALKPGQSVLVQVTKDPIGSKGARLTTEISLAGRYLVLQPGGNTFGISRRLPEEERARLRDILKEVRPKGLGVIVRTAAEGAIADDLRSDLARLQARWEQVDRKAKKASAPAVIYQEPELVVRVIRDIFSPDFVELIVDDRDLYERVRDYLGEVAPDLLGKLKRHDGRLPLFEQYRLVEQIHKALERKVWLPSGGSIVIDRTEAMTVIDVNTGKFVGKSSSSLEETVVANNLEAADEIVRQLRLRDIGGIVIIDFIDMLFEANQQKVLDRLKAALARDKTKSQVMEISSLGLVQMTRKRVSGGLLESFSRPCKHCEGRGIVITHDIG